MICNKRSHTKQELCHPMTLSSPQTMFWEPWNRNNTKQHIVYLKMERNYHCKLFAWWSVRKTFAPFLVSTLFLKTCCCCCFSFSDLDPCHALSLAVARRDTRLFDASLSSSHKDCWALITSWFSPRSQPDLSASSLTCKWGINQAQNPVVWTWH